MSKAVVWTSSARWVVRAIGFLSTLFLARLLTPEDFGIVAIAFVLMAVVEAFSALDTGSALLNEDKISDALLNTAWTMRFLRNLFVAAIICICAQIAPSIYDQPELELVLYIIAGNTAMMGLNNPALVLFNKNIEFHHNFFMDVINKVLSAVVAIAFAFVFRNYLALVAGAVTATCVTIVYSYAVFHYRPKFTLTEWRTIFSFSSWLTLKSMVSALNWRVDTLIIGGVLGAEKLGIYRVSSDMSGLATVEVASSISPVLHPSFVLLRDDGPRFKSLFMLVVQLLYMLILPLGIGLGLLSDQFVLIVLGAQWIEAIDIISILAHSSAMLAITMAVESALLAKGRVKLLFQREALLFAVRMPLILIGLFTAGLMGVVYARVAYTFVSFFIHVSLARGLFGLGWASAALAPWRSYVSVGIMVATVLGVRDMLAFPFGSEPDIALTLLAVLAGALSYVLSHVTLWIAAGRPDGAEARAIQVLSTLLRKGSSELGNA